MATKNLVEDTLIQIKNLEDVINENAKEILQSTMKEEISELVKESIKEADEDENEDEVPTGMEDSDESDDNVDDSNEDLDGEDEDEFQMDQMDFTAGDNQTIDLTKGATNDEVASIFKKLKDTDEVIVVRDGDNLDLTVNGEEYLIKLNENSDLYEDDDEVVDDSDNLIPMDEDDDMLPTGDENLEEDFEDDDDDKEAMFDRIFAEMDSNDEYTSENETMYELEMDDDMMPTGDENLEEDFDELDFDEFDDEDVANYEDFSDEEGFMNESRKSKKKTVKPVGKNIGKPKFEYKKATGGFKEKMKQGTKKLQSLILI